MSNTKHTKRDATAEEEEALVTTYEKMQPGRDYRTELQTCKGQGLKTEICSCGMGFCAFTHFVRCFEDNCPMKAGDGKTLLDHLLGDDAKPDKKE